MPLSNAADRVAKSLHPFLSGKIAVSELKALGWFDFLSQDRPDTTDPIRMGLAAFLYLTLEDDGSWNGQKAVLTAITAFLHQQTRKTPTVTDLADLKSLLGANPVDANVIEEWFERVYR